MSPLLDPRLLHGIDSSQLIRISLALYFNLRQRMVGFNHSTDTMLQMLIKVALKTASYTAIVSIGGGESMQLECLGTG